MVAVFPTIIYGAFFWHGGMGIFPFFFAGGVETLDKWG
jgi:hypothetical protein